MKKHLSLFSLLTVILSITVSGESAANLVENGNAGNGLENWTGPLQVVANGPENASCFSVAGSKMILTRNFIEIDPSKSYRLSGAFKSAGSGANVVMVGLRLYNADKKEISATSVSAIPDSGTTLIAGAGAGATQLKVRDAASWENAFQNRRLVIALSVDAGGEYRDLPNFQTRRVVDLRKSDDGWEVSLEKPLDVSYPEGTAVRAHLMSGHFLYAFNFNKQLAGWTNYQGVIKPVLKSGAIGSSFWPGTKYAKVIILANWGQSERETLLFGNISLEEIKPAN